MCLCVVGETGPKAFTLSYLPNLFKKIFFLSWDSFAKSLNSSDWAWTFHSCASASQSVRMTDVHHHPWLKYWNSTWNCLQDWVLSVDHCYYDCLKGWKSEEDGLFWKDLHFRLCRCSCITVSENAWKKSTSKQNKQIRLRFKPCRLHKAKTLCLGWPVALLVGPFKRPTLATLHKPQSLFQEPIHSQLASESQKEESMQLTQGKILLPQNSAALFLDLLYKDFILMALVN